MIEPMHLYPEEKKRMQEAEKQGLSVMTCNNWLCPFNNDGYCVEPTKGDICGIYGDEDFNKYLDVVYDENYSDDFRDSVRRVMIARWGKKEQRLIYADAIEKVLEEKHFKRVLDSDRWLIADIKKSIMDLPTVDAVPVIQCKDCIHNVANRKTDPIDITDYSGQDIVCDYFMTDGQEPDDYCSKAEPKERTGEQ